MNQLSQKRIIVGLTGGISAYRTLELIRRLRLNHALVTPLATEHALHFVTQASIEALSGQTCLLDKHALIDGKITHVETAYQSDLIVVAPATCDFLAKMAHGFADNLLLQTCLSFKGSVIVAPAMETHMWENTATQHNIQTLLSRGVTVVGPECGNLASGRSGMGRMANIEAIFESILRALSPQDFTEIQAVITAGPTVENIDPVRYISNHSSGKMGVALARALAHRGAQVELIHGPLSTSIPTLENIHPHPVQTAMQMFDKTVTLAPQSQLAILCAAVADYRPQQFSLDKIKKNHEDTTIKLARNPDILSALGTHPSKPFLVGFAAETSNLEVHAQKKCIEKNCDLICANLINDNENPFGSEESQLTLLDKSGWIQHLDKQHKYRTAHQILDIVRKRIHLGR